MKLKNWKIKKSGIWKFRKSRNLEFGNMEKLLTRNVKVL